MCEAAMSPMSRILTDSSAEGPILTQYEPSFADTSRPYSPVGSRMYTWSPE